MLVWIWLATDLGTIALFGFAGAMLMTVLLVRWAARPFQIEHEARERAEQLDQTRTGFATIVAHELRNPMATIRGFAQMLRDQPELLQDDKRQEAYDVIVRQVDRMASILDNIVDISRIESGTFGYAFVSYDVRDLLVETINDVQANWPGHPIRLDAADLPARATGDRDRLQKVIGSLLSNACRYSPDGEEVLVRAQADRSSISVAVTDRGSGVDEARRERLFQPALRPTSSGSSGTGGLGTSLYISRHIVEAHGGSITVDSEVGRGSTFTMTVPLEPPGASEPTG